MNNPKMPYRSFSESGHPVAPLTEQEIVNRAYVRRTTRDEESRWLVQRLVETAVVMAVTGGVLWLLKITGFVEWIQSFRGGK
jgi:hypothetical protein